MGERIGMIGLGVMGSAMARNLLTAGHQVMGFDLDAGKTEALVTQGLLEAESAGGVAAGSDLLVFSLPSVTALSNVTAEVAANAHDGLLCLETGTFPLDAKSTARSLLAAKGVELMDTPLSGTGLQAADATLVIFASGSRDGFKRALSVFDAIGRSSHYLGAFGNGSRMKYIANLLVAVHNLAAAEAHALGIAAGLDPALVQQLMTDGVGSSKILEIRGPMMVNDDYPTAARLDIILKDARIIKDFAESVGAPTPLLDAAIPVYVESSAAGLGAFDAAVLCRYLEDLGGMAR